MAKIAFLGLGQMGTPMATRLLRDGHELVIWNRTPDRSHAVNSVPSHVRGCPIRC
jgi:3-hydroxyisobutyrate dehydrogenase-like beta-hydroxyacid dehydrogenase